MLDTRIFSRELDRLRLYISVSYRGARCLICSTMQDGAELVHAIFTHQIRGRTGVYENRGSTPIIICIRADRIRNSSYRQDA